jgi:hypothetical protein
VTDTLALGEKLLALLEETITVSTYAGVEHLETILERNRRWGADLASIAETKRWPRESERTLQITRVAYLLGPDERAVWGYDLAGDHPVRTVLGRIRPCAGELLLA